MPASGNCGLWASADQSQHGECLGRAAGADAWPAPAQRRRVARQAEQAPLAARESEGCIGTGEAPRSQDGLLKGVLRRMLAKYCERANGEDAYYLFLGSTTPSCAMTEVGCGGHPVITGYGPASSFGRRRLFSWISRAPEMLMKSTATGSQVGASTPPSLPTKPALQGGPAAVRTAPARPHSLTLHRNWIEA